MPDIAILGSMCTGHGEYPPRPNAEGEPLHTINGVPVHCQGHAWMPHISPVTGETHPGTTASGCTAHTINGKPVARVDDKVSCTSKIASGQPLHSIDG